MAFVVKRDQGSKVGQAIAAGLGAIPQAIDFTQRLQHAQDQHAQIQQELGQREEVMNQQRSEFKLKGLNAMGDMLFGAALSDSPKDAVNLMGDRLATWGQALGSQVDLNQLADKAQALSKVAKKPIQEINAAMSAMNNPALDDQAAMASYQRGRDALANLKQYMSVDLAGAKENALDQAAAKRFHFAELKALQGQRMEASAQKATVKDDQALEKRFNDTVGFLQGQKRVGASGPFQMAQQKLALANASENWLSAMKSGRVVANQTAIAQLKSNIDSMVAGGSGRSAEMVKILLEHTNKSKLADALQYVTSKPQAAASKEFLAQYEQELQVEKEAWTQKRNQYLDAAVGDLGEALNDPKRKERFSKIIKGIAPDYNPFPGEAATSSQAPSAAPEGMVKVQLASGQTGAIPSDKLKDFLTKHPGAKQL